MGMSAFSVMTSVLVLYFHHFGTVQRPPKLIRLVAFKLLARALCMHAHVPDENQTVPVLQPTREMSGKSDSAKADVESLRTCAGSEDATIESALSCRTTGSAGCLMNASRSPDCWQRRPGNTTGSDKHVKEILQHIRGMVTRVEQRERDDVILGEWKAVAHVMDRGFFAFALIALFCVTLAIFA